MQTAEHAEQPFDVTHAETDAIVLSRHSSCVAHQMRRTATLMIVVNMVAEALREAIRTKCRELAAISLELTTSTCAARLLLAVADALPDVAMESCAGVANPLSLRPLLRGERLIDVRSGAGFECF
jgi:hypothetical protein